MDKGEVCENGIGGGVEFVGLGEVGFGGGEISANDAGAGEVVPGFEEAGVELDGASIVADGGVEVAGGLGVFGVEIGVAGLFGHLVRELMNGYRGGARPMNDDGFRGPEGCKVGVARITGIADGSIGDGAAGGRKAGVRELSQSGRDGKAYRRKQSVRRHEKVTPEGGGR